MSATQVLFDGWEFVAGFLAVLLLVLVVSSRDRTLSEHPYDRVHGDSPGASSDRVGPDSLRSLTRGTR